MDSEPVAGGDSREKELELLRWGKSPRVYTRKYPKRTKLSESAVGSQQQLQQESSRTVITTVDEQSSLQLKPLDDSSSHSDNQPPQPPLTTENDGELLKGNELVGYTYFEDQVRINLTVLGRNDLIELRNKLKTNLIRLRF